MRERPSAIECEMVKIYKEEASKVLTEAKLRGDAMGAVKLLQFVSSKEVGVEDRKEWNKK